MTIDLRIRIKSIRTQIVDEFGDEVLDEIDSHGLNVELFMDIYEYLLKAQMVTISEIAQAVVRAEATVRRYLHVLRQIDNIHLTEIQEIDHRDTYYCYAPEFLAVLCKRRKISVGRFLLLRPIIEKFMAECEKYYMRRIQDDARYPETDQISKLKRQYVAIIQPMVSPRTPLKDWKHPITTHPAMRYLRTAQDLILNELGIQRKFTERVKGEMEEDVYEKDLGKDEGFLAEEFEVEEVRGVTKLRCTICGELIDEEKMAKHLQDELKKRSDRLWQEMEGEIEATEADDSHQVITCIDCGAPRIVKNQDAFQVKRCTLCQKIYRREKARERRAAQKEGQKKTKKLKK